MYLVTVTYKIDSFIFRTTYNIFVLFGGRYDFSTNLRIRNSKVVPCYPLVNFSSPFNLIHYSWTSPPSHSATKIEFTAGDCQTSSPTAAQIGMKAKRWNVRNWKLSTNLDVWKITHKMSGRMFPTLLKGRIYSFISTWILRRERGLVLDTSSLTWSGPALSKGKIVLRGKL